MPRFVQAHIRSTSADFHSFREAARGIGAPNDDKIEIGFPFLFAFDSMARPGAEDGHVDNGHWVGRNDL